MTNASFTPTFDDADVDTNYGSTGGDIVVPQFKSVKPFRFWCQKTMPMTYDDSLSYYELLSKVVNYLNNMMNDLNLATGSIEEFAEQFVINQKFLNDMAKELGVNTRALEDYINDRMQDFLDAYNDLQDYVNDYFNNLDVQEEINTKLDVMASDGTLDELFMPHVQEWLTEQGQAVANQNSRISVLEGRMDTFASLPSGSTSGNAELLDIRTNFLGETFGSAGDAVRTSDLVASGYTPLAITSYMYENQPTGVGWFDVTKYKGGRIAFIANIAYNSIIWSQLNGLLLKVSDTNTGVYDGHVLTPDSEDEYYYGNFIEEFYEKPLAVYTHSETSEVYDSSRVLCIFKVKEDFPYKYIGVNFSTESNITTPLVPIIRPDLISYGTYWVETPIDQTLSITGEAADAKATGDALSELNERIDNVYIESANIYNPATDRHNTNIDGNGVISTSELYKATDYIYVGANNTVAISHIADSIPTRIFFYRSNNANDYSRSLWLNSDAVQTFKLASTENYIVLTMLEQSPPFMVNLGNTLLPYIPYAGEAGDFLQNIIDNINDSVDVKVESVRESSAQKEIINRFDKTTISEGKYLSTSTGGLDSNSNFFASDFIDISDLVNVWCSYTHIVCFYDANKGFISGTLFDTNGADNYIEKPSNAVFMRFSGYNTFLDVSQIGKSVTRANYIEYGKYILPDYKPLPNKIIVDASGNGDYTSITEALYEHVNDGLDIEVKPGTYNIVSEYIDLFGQEAVDSMADADSAIFNGFQYGIIIRNRTIKFDSGSYVVCDWTGHTVNGTHRFSALRVDYNCKIIGLHLVSTATFYAIHDDYGLSVPYTVEYEHCYVEGINLYNANCIGGGCKKYSRHIIKNCYFNNHLTDSATVRYHNTNAEGAVPEIYVSNCYFNNWFTPRWYGTQTSKMKVYVNNCEARAIYKVAESSSFNVDNVELYKWCNTETNPIT